ncbi:organic solute transporter alpha-like protein [Choristoneura fumiferana]|uniref:organic solute transporter alpha-like protein n=1 Tax=Choristoneura fumiferana TaxID=7141 RepID=UPI003D154F19
MDLQSEASSEKRILIARHISAEKALDVPNNAVNTTFLCHSYTLQPDFRTYAEALQVYGWVLWACALLCVCVACALYACNVRSALRHWGGAATHVAFVLAVYPVVSIAAFMALVVPRTQVLSEAISQEAVMLGLYHFYCLVVAECGGPEHLVRRTEGSLLETRVLPCCFYPCCILPRPKLQPRHFKVLRMLLLQVPVIQGLIYIAILGLRAEDVSVYLSNYIYFQPLVAASVLTGIWGIMMCLKAAEATGARPRARFLALQFALIIVKVQCGVAKTLPTLTSLKCLFALNPSVVVDLIHNTVTILEMLLLSIWAWRLYKVPPGKILENEQNIMPAE